MLEMCSDLIQCEEILASKVKHVTFIGQVPLSIEDTQKLGDLIRDRAAADIAEGTKSLSRFTPVSLACFLVGCGVWFYDQGDYWTGVSKLTGVIDDNWLSKWGQVFISFIARNNLQVLGIPGAHRYVANILLHAGIPQNCAFDYFRVASSMVEKGIVSQEEAANYLAIMRQQEERRLDLNKKKQQLESQLSKFSQEIQHFEELVLLINQESSLKKRAGSPGEIAGLPDTISGFNQIQQEKSRMKQSICKLIEEKDILLKEAFLYSFNDRLALSLRDEIELVLGSFSEQDLSYDLEIKMMFLTGIFLDKPFVNRNEAISNLKNTLIQAEERIRAATEAGELLKGARLRIEENEKHYFDKKREVADLERRLKILGNGVLEEGLKEVFERRQAFEKIKAIGRDIATIVRNMNLALTWPLELQAVIDIRKTKEDDLQNLQTLAAAIETELESLTPYIPIVDEPVQRFLSYGRQWAGEWLAEAVSLIASCHSERQLPVSVPNYLPWRIYESFVGYLTENNGPEDTKDTLSNYCEPTLCLNPASSIISIAIGQQRFRLAEPKKIFLRIEEEGSLEQIEVKAYWCGKGLIKTDPVHWILRRIAPSYRVSLIVEETQIQAWEIPGFRLHEPFLIFDEKGIRVKDNNIMRKRLWFLIPRGYIFDPPVQVVEKTFWAQADASFSLSLIDLQDWEEGTLFLIKPDGRRIPLCMPEQSINEPSLWGGKLIGAIRVAEDKVYTKAPYLRIPLQNKNPADWKIVIISRKGTVGHREHHSLDTLSKEAIFWPAQNGLDLPLGSPKLLGLNPIGRFSVWLWHSQNRIKFYRFNLALLPDLVVAWRPQVFLPPVENDMHLSLDVLLFEEAASFSVESPAKLESVDQGCYEVRVPSSEAILSGNIVFQSDPEVANRIPIHLPLPKLLWRMPGHPEYGNWQQRIVELWLGDWEGQEKTLVELKAPDGFHGQAVLATEDGTRVEFEKFKNSVARFDLLSFYDTLRRREKSFRTIELTVKDSKNKVLCQGPLFYVLTRWQVEEIKWVFESGEDQGVLKIEWREKGKAINRYLRISHAWSREKEAIDVAIPDNETNLKITWDPSWGYGRFNAQFIVLDSWTGSALENPVSENPIIIDIDDGLPYFKEYYVKHEASNELVVSGIVANGNKGVIVSAVVYGFAKGYPHSVVSQTQTDTKGCFQVVIPTSMESSQWLGVFLDTVPPVYEVFAINRKYPPEIPIAHMLLSEYASLSSVPGVCLRIRPHGGYLDRPDLDSKTSKKILRGLQQGESNFGFILSVGGKNKKAKLQSKFVFDSLQFDFGLEQGAKCTSCGEILPDQEDWGRNHYPRCKSLVPIYEDMKPVSVNLLWKPAVHSSLPFLGSDSQYVLLFSNRSNPLPNSQMSFIGDAQTMGWLLWRKELENYLQALAVEEVKERNEHKPA